MMPYPITTADLLYLLYPHGRLRSSRAYQGASLHTNWNAFAQEESCQAITGASPPRRALSDTVVAQSPENE